MNALSLTAKIVGLVLISPLLVGISMVLLVCLTMTTFALFIWEAARAGWNRIFG